MGEEPSGETGKKCGYDKDLEAYVEEADAEAFDHHSAAAQAPGALRYRQIEDHRMAKADAPMSRRLLLFGAVLLATAVLSVYTRVKSKRLPDFLDTPSNERLPVRTKLKAFAAVGRRGEDD